MSSITVLPRFCGPPASGNGGYVAGRLATELGGGGPVTVTLRQPPPLDRELNVVRDQSRALLLDGDLLVAEAAAGAFAVDPVEPVSLEAARAAEPRYPGLDDHSFDHCFVCGPGRALGDGMRLSPGPIRPGWSACSWVPDSSLAEPDHPAVAAPEFVWAAMDCPGGWTSDLVARPLVLGRMTADRRGAAADRRARGHRRTPAQHIWSQDAHCGGGVRRGRPAGRARRAGLDRGRPGGLLPDVAARRRQRQSVARVAVAVSSTRASGRSGAAARWLTKYDPATTSTNPTTVHTVTGSSSTTTPATTATAGLT